MTGTGADAPGARAAVSSAYRGAERRTKLRLRGPFPALARGEDADGEPFEAGIVIDDISAGGLHARLRRRAAPGTILFLVVRLSSAPAPGSSAPRVAVRGVVLRSEAEAGGSFRVAAAILRHRFLDP